MLHKMKSLSRPSTIVHRTIQQSLSVRSRSSFAKSKTTSSRFFQQQPITTIGDLNSGSIIFRRTFASGGGSYGDPFARYQSVRTAVNTLIGLNIVVFGAWQYAIINKDSHLLHRLTQNFTISVNNFKEGRWWTLLTSAFSHQNLIHIAFNMIALNAFGSIMAIIPGVGAVHVISMCIGSAIAGSAAFLYQKSGQSASDPKLKDWSDNVTRMPQMVSGLGASGMVMGAGATAACLMPFAPMQIMFIPINIPLWVLTLGYAALDTYFLHSNSPIGHAAHLGGAIYGAAFYLAYLRNYGGVWPMARRMILRR